MKTLTPRTAIIFIFIILFSREKIIAQFGTQIPMQPNIGPSVIYRPSVFPQNKFFLGVPLISNLNVGFTHDGLDFFGARTQTDSGIVLDMNKLMEGLEKQNTIALEYSMDVLSYGFRIKKSYFSINVSHRVPIIFRYSGDFLKMLYYGNGAYIGQTMDFSKTYLSATNYWEIGVGFNRKITDKLSAGIRVRRLFGLDNISTDINTLKATTSTENFAMQLESDMVINSSSPMNQPGGFGSLTDFKGYLLTTRNWGMAFNAGVAYQYNDKLLFSMDALDWGDITWRNNTSNNKLVNGTYTFSGVGMGQMFNSSDTSVNYIDSLANSFKSVDTKEQYVTPLPGKLMFCTEYQFAKKLYASLMLRGMFLPNEMIPGGAIMIRKDFGKHLSLDVNYSRQYNSYNSIGAGASLRMGTTNLFVFSDNLPGTIFPTKGKSVHVNFGLCVLI